MRFIKFVVMFLLIVSWLALISKGNAIANSFDGLEIINDYCGTNHGKCEEYCVNHLKIGKCEPQCISQDGFTEEDCRACVRQLNECPQDTCIRVLCPFVSVSINQEECTNLCNNKCVPNSEWQGCFVESTANSFLQDW